MRVDIKTYDPDALVGDDARRMEGFDAAVERAVNVLPNLSLETGITTVDMILSDVRNLMASELSDQLAASRVYYAKQLMESNPTAYNLEGEQQ